MLWLWRGALGVGRLWLYLGRKVEFSSKEDWVWMDLVVICCDLPGGLAFGVWVSVCTKEGVVWAATDSCWIRACLAALTLAL